MNNIPPTFTVVVGDLVNSRNADRQKLSHQMPSVINHISKEFRDEFHAPLVLTKGIDEVSGVLKRAAASYRICRLANQRLYPHLFRFAVVTGALDIAIDTRNARKMDGPAFHKAAEMISRGKKSDFYYSFHLNLQCGGLDLWFDELTNLIHLVWSDWTNHQRLVVRSYEELHNQKMAAKRLGITQQAVSDALRQAHWKELNRAETMINKTLEKYDTQQPV